MAVDREYRIKISTVADNSGAKATGDAMDELGKKTGKAGEAAKGAAKEGLEKFEVSGREARVLISKLGPDVEGLGHLFTSLTSPIAAAGFGLVVLKGLYDEYNKKQQETVERNAEVVESFKAIVEAHNEAIQKAAELREEMTRTADETMRANTAFENRMKLLKAETEEGKKLGEARGETPRLQAYREKAERDAELATRTRHLGDAEARQAILGGEHGLVAEAEARAAEDKIKGAKLNADAEAASKDTARLKKEMDDAVQKALKLNEETQKYSEKYGLGLNEAQIKALNPEANTAAEKATAAYNLNQEFIQHAATFARTASTSASEAAHLQEEFNKNKKFIEEEGPAIKSQGAVNLKKDEDIYVADLKAQAGPFTGAEIEEVAGVERLERQHAAMANAKGQGYDWTKDSDISDKQRDLVKRFEDYSKDHGNFLQHMLNQMFILGGTQTTVMQRMPALEGVMKEIQRLEAQLQSQARFNVANPPVGG